MAKTYGTAGRIAAAFIHSKLTPLFILASLALGALAVLALPREEEPQIIVPMVDVFVEMPGATPADVEQRVTRPLEQLLGAEKLKPVHDYLRDVDDHLRRVTEQVEGYDELIDSILDANLTRVSVQQNDDMRKISAYVALAAVPTLIAGVYGMNFDHMPELHWYYGYPYALGLMATVVGLLYRAFKRSGWL